MLRLLQVINYMLVNLELSEQQVIETFEALQEGRLNQTGLYLELGLETCNDTMFNQFDKALPKWKSALEIIKMRIQ